MLSPVASHGGGAGREGGPSEVRQPERTLVRTGQSSAEPGAYRPGYELVAERTLRLIGEIALAPGDRMPTDQDLGARLGASRTMAREAVKILDPKVRRLQGSRGDPILRFRLEAETGPMVNPFPLPSPSATYRPRPYCTRTGPMAELDHGDAGLVILRNVPARVRSGLRRHRPMPGRRSVQGLWWGASS